MANAENQKAFRDRSQAHGFCPCGQAPPQGGRTTCDYCADTSKARAAAQRKRAKDAASAVK